jgi:phosphohistidine phosphatase SixA
VNHSTCKAVRLAFVRHAHPEKPFGGDKRLAPLTPHGVKAARLAGQFLLGLGIRPTVALATDTVRTVSTAEIVKSELHLDMPLGLVRSGFSRLRASLDSNVDQWMARAVPCATILFIGHDASQACLAGILGVSIPRRARGCVIIADRGGTGSWALVDHWPGLT